MHVFKFPNDRDDFLNTLGLHDLKYRLGIHEDNFTEVRLKNIYEVKEACINHIYVLYAKCKYCRSHLKYKKSIEDQKERYQLVKYENQHEHVIRKTDVTTQMVDYLRTAYGKVPENLLKVYFMEKFEKIGVSQRQYEKTFQIVKKDSQKKAFILELQDFGRQNYMSMVKKSHLNFQMNTQEKQEEKQKVTNKQDYPIFLFISTPEMKSLYQRFGRIIYLHRFPYLISKNTVTSQDWIVIVISGIDNFNSIIFYGFSICYGLSQASMYLTFKSFFEHHPLEKCETVVTENQQQINKGFQQFIEIQSKSNSKQKNLVQLWDLMLDAKERNEERKKIQKCLIASSSQKQYEALINDYRRKIKGCDGTKFEMFIKKANRYCLLEIPNTFIGIRMGLDHFHQIFNSINKNFPKEETYSVFVFKFTKYLKETKLIRARTSLLTKVLITPLTDCYPVVSEYCLNYLYETLIEANMVNFYPNQGKDKIRIGNNTIIMKRIDRQGKTILECDCNMKMKTGLPCTHIMRVCLYYKIPVSSQIDQFWNATKELQPVINEEKQVKYHKISLKPFR